MMVIYRRLTEHTECMGNNEQQSQWTFIFAGYAPLFKSVQ